MTWLFVRYFVDVCTRKGLEVNAVKSKLLVLNREEGLEYEIYANGIQLKRISKFKYICCFG